MTAQARDPLDRQLSFGVTRRQLRVAKILLRAGRSLDEAAEFARVRRCDLDVALWRYLSEPV